jgi:hypothetical protein
MAGTGEQVGYYVQKVRDFPSITVFAVLDSIGVMNLRYSG